MTCFLPGKHLGVYRGTPMGFTLVKGSRPCRQPRSLLRAARVVNGVFPASWLFLTRQSVHCLRTCVVSKGAVDLEGHS
jgi:hypothetical protein